MVLALCSVLAMADVFQLTLTLSVYAAGILASNLTGQQWRESAIQILIFPQVLTGQPKCLVDEAGTDAIGVVIRNMVFQFQFA